MTYLISVLPIFIYLFLLVYLDVFSIIKKERIWAAFLYGVLSCLVLYIVGTLLNVDPWMPVVEEICKYSVIIYLLRRNKMAFLSDASIYGASVGAGFALLENILYAYELGDPSLMVCVYRGIATSLLHIGVSAAAAALLLILTKWRPLSYVARHKVLAAVLAIIPSLALHFLHNLFIVDVKISLIAVMITQMSIFLLFFFLNQRYIHQWMEHSLNDEVNMAASIKAGKLSETPAGCYLLSVKEQFNPEVFFDIIMYVNLYYDLSLTSKRFIMLKEMEMEVPEEDLQLFREKMREFYQLRRNVGKTGAFTLAPLVDSKKIDAVINLF